jgi:hypothetical protein
MKRNAKLYLPWPAVSAFLAPVAVQAADAQLYRGGKALASVERLKGGFPENEIANALDELRAGVRPRGF